MVFCLTEEPEMRYNSVRLVERSIENEIYIYVCCIDYIVTLLH